MKRIVNGGFIECAGGAMAALPVGAPGVFETMMWREGKPIFWSAHWQRFTAGCRWHRFEPPCDATTLLQAAQDLTAANAISGGVVRFAAYREDARVEWVVDAGPARPHMLLPAFRATWGPSIPEATPDRAFKHLARTRWLEALADARNRGFQETLLCDGAGRVVEASVSNVFVVRDGVLSTPDARLGPLPGVVRAEVLALARTLGWRVSEGALMRRDVETADEAWLTNSLIGIRPMSDIGDVGLSPAHPQLDELRTAWRMTHGWDPSAPQGAGA